MDEIHIPLPEGLPEMLKMSRKEFEMGKVSAGLAAQIAGVDKVTFLNLLHRYGVPAINLKDEEVEREIEAARELEGGGAIRKTASRSSSGGSFSQRAA